MNIVSSLYNIMFFQKLSRTLFLHFQKGSNFNHEYKFVIWSWYTFSWFALFINRQLFLENELHILLFSPLDRAEFLKYFEKKRASTA